MRYELDHEGHIDSLDHKKLSGWVRRIGEDEPIKIAVLINGIKRLTTAANEEREDLKNRGSGKWGFSISTETLKLKKGDRVRVKTAKGDFELRNSPILYNTYGIAEPWAESDLFSEYRKEHSESPLLNLADWYHTDGYVILHNVIDPKLIDRVKVDTAPVLSDKNRGGRIQDAWRSLPSVKEIALNSKVRETIDFFYGRKSIPFQTLNFEFGTQQPAHSDTIHFSCIPARFMCGAWVALEDTTPDNGPLFYYPGSHRLKEYKLSDMGIIIKEKKHSYEDYEQYIARLMKSCGFVKQQLIVKKGDVLIWASNLAHGGGVINDKTKTRWSQVTHYYFEGCVYYTPFFSDEISGEYALKEIVNIETSKIVPSTYNGIQLNITDVGGGLFKIKL